MLRFMATVAILAPLIVSGCGRGVAIDEPTDALRPAMDRVRSAAPVSEVLLLGTFHFSYPGLDDHKTDASKQIDVLSAERQREVEGIVARLAEFRPTRIAVEAGSDEKTNAAYAEYRAGARALTRNEVHQIGFRLAARLGLARVDTIDTTAWSDDFEPRYKDEDWWKRVEEAMKKAEETRGVEQAAAYRAMYDAEDEMAVRRPLDQTLIALNDPVRVRLSHGHYLVTGFRTDDSSGPDALAMWWYNRNLRMFRNIQRLTEAEPGQRVLVIVGAGHLPIIRHCVECAPDLRLVEVRDVLGAQRRADQPRARHRICKCRRGRCGQSAGLRGEGDSARGSRGVGGSGTWSHGQPVTNFVWKQPKSAAVRRPSALQSDQGSALTKRDWKQPKSATVSAPSALQSA